MRQSILEGVNMNHPPPSALLPSPTFVPPMMPPLYPVSLYSRAMGSMPPHAQGRSRGFAGQYLRMSYLSSSVSFIITHAVILAKYHSSSFTCVFSRLLSILGCGRQVNSLPTWRVENKAHWIPSPLSVEVFGPQAFASHQPRSGKH